MILGRDFTEFIAHLCPIYSVKRKNNINAFASEFRILCFTSNIVSLSSEPENIMYAKYVININEAHHWLNIDGNGTALIRESAVHYDTSTM